jgi:lysophospholipase
VVQSLHSYLPRATITGFDLSHYLNSINASNVPIVGLAISGGGTQSGLGGLGLWQAFDDRYPPAVQAGIGGLTQCLSYLTGLSGGGCVTVSSLYVAVNVSKVL